ncbi:MAG: glycosyltransferase [Lachnospiraceae bacterium]|nr:glycosyltransferase [Lachnospiraceae bacterium]
MKQIRILQSEIGDGVGGIESFLYSVYTHIDRDRYHFDYITRAEHPAFEREFADLGAHIYRISSYRNPMQYRHDLEKVMSHGYDVIHINKNSAANIVPFVIAKKCTGAAVVAHSHNTNPSVGKISELMHYLHRDRLYELSDVHLACSDAAGKWMYGSRDFEFIPNGIDVGKFRFDERIRTEYRQKLGLGDAFTLINVGRFFPQKNQLRLVDIFSEVVKKRPDSKLILVGSGDLEDEIRKRVSKYSLQDKVIFTGHRKDVNALLMAADCFVMTSVYEGLGIAAIEAEAAGLSVFVSEHIPQEVFVSDDVHRFSLEDTDTVIADLLVSTDGKSCPDREKDNDRIAASDYNIDVTVEKLEEIYDLSSNGNL